MTTNLSEQISSAVSIALNSDPTTLQSTRHEAHLFLTQVKEAHQQTWQACLSLFLEEEPVGSGSKRWSNEARLFGIQVVGESLAGLSPEALAFVQTSLFDYFTREYVQGTAENRVAFLKNASLRTVTLLFLQLYPVSSPQFLTNFIALARVYPTSIQSTLPSPAPLNPQTTDLILRLLHEVATEISDAQLRLNKPGASLARDSELRDAVRIRDAAGISAVIWEIIAESLDGLDSPEVPGNKVGLKGQAAKELAEISIRVIGDYVSWIDINLMVTPVTIPLLLRGLHLASPTYTAIRIATADALIDTVTKGMPSNDKLALLSVLDLATVLHQLVNVGRTSPGLADNETEMFREKLAKVLNGMGTELCKITEDDAAPIATKSSALSMITSLFPLLLQFLSDINDETASAVFPFANAILSMYKKDKKRAGSSANGNVPNTALTVEKRGFLSELLRVVFQRMQYGVDAEWSMSAEGDEDDDELAFATMRKSLKVILDAVALIDPELYSDAARSIVIATLEVYEVGGATAAALTWQRLELALYLAYCHASTTSGSGPAAFVIIPPEELQRAKQQADHRIKYTSFPLSQVGEMMLRICRSKIINYPHPAISLQLFEIVVRYHDFFHLCPEYIVEILPSFLDEHGLHQSDEVIQTRVSYLFNRFIYSAKATLQAQVSGELISTILSRMQDLLVVKAELPPCDILNNESLIKAAAAPSAFTGQLYLFETVGTLISILNQVPTQQVTLLRSALAPLLSSLQTSVRTNVTTVEDFAAVFRVHHLILAVGNVGKGFPDLSIRVPVPSGSWVEIFKEATEGILTAAKSMSQFVIIREAARFAFNRIVSTTGEIVLPLIPTLIDCLIGDVTFAELADLLNFLGLLATKYKMSILTILDTLLLPVFNRVFYFLKLPITGTDDVVQHSTLRRAYFTLIISIVASNLQEVFYSPKNKDHLPDILQSITHYISHDALANDQKGGFQVLHRMALLWVTNYQDPSAPPPAPSPSPVKPVLSNSMSSSNIAPPPILLLSPVPGFEQFLYNGAVKLCFEIPLERKFDYSDAASFAVIGEISNLLKLLHTRRGSEFVQFMTTSLLPSIQCPREAAESFMNALSQATDGKQFKKFASEWLKASRGPITS